MLSHYFRFGLTRDTLVGRGFEVGFSLMSRGGCGCAGALRGR